MTFDLAQYICPNGAPYTLVGVNGSSGFEICQSERTASGYAYFRKNRNAETIWYDSLYIYRGLDTSAIDGDEVYAQFAGTRYGAVWSKRHVNIGDVSQRSPDIQHYHKDGSTNGKPHDTNILSYLIAAAHYDVRTFPNTQITVPDVIELHWTFDAAGQNVVEKYFYARSFGLVGFNYVRGPGGYQSEIGALTSAPPPPRLVVDWFNEPTPPPTVAPSPDPMPSPVPVPPVEPPANKANPVQAKLVQSNVRLRRAPGTAAKIIRQMKLGEPVIYYEQPITHANSFDWVWVETSNGQGYAARSIDNAPVFSAG